MNGFLSRLIRRDRAAPPAQAPEGWVVYAVGDVHGRADLLARLLEDVARDAARETGLRREVIFLGDYVDRGLKSRETVDLVRAAAASGFWTTTCLKGNHEDTLLKFLQDPMVGQSWIEFGGRETLASYGAPAPAMRSDKAAWLKLRDDFEAALPPEHLAFFQGLDLMAVRGDYVFVHAGVRPGVALDDQAPEDLMWIRDDFLRAERACDKTVVHGHTPEPDAHDGRWRIGVDTGAYATNVLTAVKLKGTERSFIQARGRPGEA